MTPWSCSGDGDDWTGLTAAIRNQRLDTDQEDIMDMTPLAGGEDCAGSRLQWLLYE